MKKILILFSLILGLSCSSKFYHPEKLAVSRRTYFGEVKTHGYYIGKYSNDIYIFYRNGVVRRGWRISDSNQLSDTAINTLFNSRYAMECPCKWGTYAINNLNTIAISGWIEVGSWFGDYPQATDSGKIINETTFLLKRNPYPYPTKKIDSEIDTFYFHPMQVKPDSVNKYFDKWYK